MHRGKHGDTKGRSPSSTRRPSTSRPETWTTDIDGEVAVVRRGERRRGDTPEVQARPEFFVPDDGRPLPPEDLPDLSWRASETFDAVVLTTPVLDLVRLRRDILVHIFGGPIIELRAGTLVARSHELVQRNRNWFMETER